MTTTEPTLTTWTQVNAIIRHHFELFERLPTFPAEAADELTDALTGVFDKALAEQRERITQAIRAERERSGNLYTRAAFVLAARLVRDTP